MFQLSCIISDVVSIICIINYEGRFSGGAKIDLYHLSLMIRFSIADIIWRTLIFNGIRGQPPTVPSWTEAVWDRRHVDSSGIASSAFGGTGARHFSADVCGPHRKPAERSHGHDPTTGSADQVQLGKQQNRSGRVRRVELMLLRTAKHFKTFLFWLIWFSLSESRRWESLWRKRRRKCKSSRRNWGRRLRAKKPSKRSAISDCWR